MNAPIKFAEETIKLEASIGIAPWTSEHNDGTQFLQDAELAMVHAKRFGGNRIEPFRPAFRANKNKAFSLSDDLEGALDRGEL